MITRKELQYVDKWASKTPMPGYEYSWNVLNEIEKCYKIFMENYSGKEYNITFSNGEEIEFKILDSNLCHMLGIDVQNIRGAYFDTYRKDILGTLKSDMTSFELLELIIENKEKVAQADNDSRNRAKAINYFKSSIKSQIFRKIINLQNFNFGAINFFGDKKEVDYEKEKTLFIQSGEQLVPYFMMGIRKNNLDEYYIVTTLLSPSNPKEFFEDQEVIIPTQIIISNDDDLSKIVATPEEKISMITMYQNIVNEYGISNNLNIFGDYLASLNETVRTRH